MKYTSFLCLLLIGQIALARGSVERVPTDAVQLGLRDSPDDKSISIDVGDGAANPKITVTMSAKIFSFNKALSIAADLLKMGDGSPTTDKVIEFDVGLGVTNPKFRWNHTDAQLEFSNDGVNYVAVGSGSGSGSGYNMLSDKNPDFEVGGVGNWTNSGGTFAAVTSGANLLFGKGSALFTASGTGQYVQSALVTAPNGLNGACQASVVFKGGDSNLKLQVLDSTSNVLAERTIESAAQNGRSFAVPFFCRAAVQYRLRMISTASASAIALDKMYLGELTTQNVSQSSLYGSIKYAAATNCIWTTTSTSFVSYAADTDCSTPTTSGNATAPATKVPGLTFGYLPPGEYLIVASGQFQRGGGVAAADVFFRFTDGSSFTAIQSYGMTAGTLSTPVISGRLNLTTGQSNVTLQAQAKIAGGDLIAGIRAISEDLEISVYRYPSNSELAITPSTASWFVDANIAGANPSLGLVNVASYSPIDNASLTLTQNPNSNAVGIACASGTTSVVGNTTCTGNENLGITFNMPAPGRVRACAEFSWTGGSAAGGIISTAFEIVETAAANVTIIQEGRSRVSAQNNVPGSAALRFPINRCGDFDFTSTGQKTLRLFYEQQLSGSTSVSQIDADASAAIGQHDIHWTVYPITQTVPMPILVGPYSQMPGAPVTVSAYTILPSDGIVDFDTTSNSITATLPTAIGARGKQITLSKVNSGANLVTVNTQIGQSIAGVAQTVLHLAGESITLYSDGSIWRWVSSNVRTEFLGYSGAGTNSVCSASPCAISQTGNWVSTLGRAGAGSYSLNIFANIFSAAPTCNGTTQNNVTLMYLAGSIDNLSTIRWDFTTVTGTSGALTDGKGRLICTGLR